MTIVTHLIEVDFGRDAQFSHPESDISAYALGFSLRYGMSESLEEVAPASTLILTLRPQANDFSLNDPTARFYNLLLPGLLIRVRAFHQGTEYTLWTGRIQKIATPATPLARSGDLQLTAQDMTPALQQGEYNPALQTSVTADEVLLALFNADLYATRWPYEDAPAAVSSYVDFEVGRTVQAWVGDNVETEAQRGIQPQAFIRQVVAPEGGGRFFWQGPTGKWTFQNREHDLMQPVAATFDSSEFTVAGTNYVFGDLLINKVSYNFVPRDVGTPGSVIYTYPTLPYAIGKRNLTTAFTARYTDANNPNARIGAIDTIEPVAATDYSATDELPLDSGDRNDRLTVTVTFYAATADVEIVSSENSTIYLQTFQLRGTPLYSYDQMTVTEKDDASIARYGIREAPSTALLSVDTEVLARGLAQWAIALYAEPFYRFERVTIDGLRSDALMAQSLARCVGDKIRINAPHLVHDRLYAIAGVQYSVVLGSITHNTTWILTPLPLLNFLILDDDVLGRLDNDNCLVL